MIEVTINYNLPAGIYQRSFLIETMPEGQPDIPRGTFDTGMWSKAIWRALTELTKDVPKSQIVQITVRETASKVLQI